MAIPPARFAGGIYFSMSEPICVSRSYRTVTVLLPVEVT
jgi:hypothetical protein